MAERSVLTRHRNELQKGDSGAIVCLDAQVLSLQTFQRMQEVDDEFPLFRGNLLHCHCKLSLEPLNGLRNDE